MCGSHDTEARRAMALFPRGCFLLTAAYDHKRAGQIVESVQPCADEPMLVCVAARKGHAVEPLIRDARAFAICRLEADDKVLVRKFGPARTPGMAGDPFDALELDRLMTGAPVPKRCVAALDCQVLRHLDVEADHELYIGLVVAGRVYSNHQ